MIIAVGDHSARAGDAIHIQPIDHRAKFRAMIGAQPLDLALRDSFSVRLSGQQVRIERLQIEQQPHELRP